MVFVKTYVRPQCHLLGLNCSKCVVLKTHEFSLKADRVTTELPFFLDTTTMLVIVEIIVSKNIDYAFLGKAILA